VLVLEIILVVVLFLAWLVALFLLVLDSISIGAKVLWFVALTLLAPITIPVYLILRRRRTQSADPRGAVTAIR
jgi:hypothetical protein